MGPGLESGGRRRPVDDGDERGLSEPARGLADASLARARARLARRTAAAGRRATAEPRRLVAHGEEWFRGPGLDIIEALEDSFGHRVDPVCEPGGPRGRGEDGRGPLDGLARRLLRLAQRGEAPDALLVSVGSDDLADASALTSPDRDGAAIDREGLVRAFVDVRLAGSAAFLAATISELCARVFGTAVAVPILIHGYDYPDAEGDFRDGWGPLRAPRRAGHDPDRGGSEARGALLRRLIDRFNTILSRLGQQPGLRGVVHVDLRGTLDAAAGDEAETAWSRAPQQEPEAAVLAAARFDAALREVLGG